MNGCPPFFLFMFREFNLPERSERRRLNRRGVPTRKVIRDAGIAKLESPWKVRLTIDAKRVGLNLRPLVSEVEAPLPAGYAIDALDLPFDHLTHPSAGQFEDGIAQRLLHERRSFATFLWNIEFASRSVLFQPSVNVFDIG